MCMQCGALAKWTQMYSNSAYIYHAIMVRAAPSSGLLMYLFTCVTVAQGDAMIPFTWQADIGGVAQSIDACPEECTH